MLDNEVDTYPVLSGRNLKTLFDCNRNIFYYSFIDSNPQFPINEITFSVDGLTRKKVEFC